MSTYENRTVVPTYYPQHKPNTYRAYATVGGSVVNLLGGDGQLHDAGGMLYPTHKNAQARARQLNYPVKYAYKRAARKYDLPAIEAWFDGYTATVILRENDELKNVINLNVRKDGMPPHSSQDFDTIEQVEEEVRTKLFFPSTVKWKIVKEEEI